MTDNTWLNPKYEPKYTAEGTLDQQDALKLVLLFYSVHWTADKKAEWLRITGTTDEPDRGNTNDEPEHHAIACSGGPYRHYTGSRQGARAPR